MIVVKQNDYDAKWRVVAKILIGGDRYKVCRSC
jgi:hypothetical protein